DLVRCVVDAGGASDGPNELRADVPVWVVEEEVDDGVGFGEDDLEVRWQAVEQGLSAPFCSRHAAAQDDVAAALHEGEGDLRLGDPEAELSVGDSDDAHESSFGMSVQPAFVRLTWPFCFSVSSTVTSVAWRTLI